ncbi:S-adenosyl-L-methionine-dependent methyltransferase [Xylariaceae sp. FL1272]|nr:S-adenosyl-L-methionine-dependent methyltransferase [Xylariaceae sp. FL1272]
MAFENVQSSPAAKRAPSRKGSFAVVSQKGSTVAMSSDIPPEIPPMPYSTFSSGESRRSDSAGKIELNAVESTLLLVLYLRVRDASSPSPILGDTYAQNIINKVNADFTDSMFDLDEKYVRYVAGRARRIDLWCQDFLDSHGDEPVSVLHLACGLDSRNLRVNRKNSVRWIDVDRPEFVGLRHRLMDTPSGDYRLVAANFVDEDDWMDEIPTDRPIMMILESLIMFLPPEKGIKLFQKLLARFPHGCIAVDTIGSITKTFSSFLEAFRQARPYIRWGIDDPNTIAALDPRLQLKDIVYLNDWMETGTSGKNGLSLFGGWTPLISLLPSYRKNGQFLLFEF